ncbi:MAG TPA: type I DNA topoisomerase [Spirochaetaceae bacterium]|nr:type I DNA topoisomerase [Spirochaetaceae bacterium]
MKKLVIVESPTKAKTISDILKKENAEVIASMGHIRDIPENGVNVDMETFKPKYAISADKKEIVRKMKKELGESDELYLATDEDREGESISWHLKEVLKPSMPVRRMVFHEITPSAIKRAFANTRDIDMNMVSAQESRRVLDRLVGYEISPLLWKTVGDRHLSAGRVQSPALKLIVDREYSRMSFVTSFYNAIKALFETSSGDKIESKLVSVNGRKIVSGKDDFDPDTGKVVNENLVLLDEKKAQRFEEEIRSAGWTVSKVSKREAKTQPPFPFITSTLQQEANSKLHFSSSKTMLVSQHLYEKGFITYMRTDSPSLSEDGENAIRDAVSRKLSSDRLSEAPRKFKSKDENAQNAHEAIRPAIIDGTIKEAQELSLTGDEAKLYGLIYRRSLASQMKDNLREITSLRIASDENCADAFEFAASGYIVVQEGFREIYGSSDEKEEAKRLPDVKEGDALDLAELTSQNMQTQPPRRWSEAALIKEMERLGIGRPSTYATTISSIVSKRYAERQDGVLVPTFTGFVIIKFLSNHLSKFLDYDFTSKMEESLDEIENQKVNEFEYLRDFYLGDGGLKDSLAFVVDDRRAEQRLHLPGVSDKYAIYVGKYGPYVSYSEKSYSIPSNVFPYMMSDERIRKIIDEKENSSRSAAYESVSVDKATGKDIFFNENGKYGPYFFIAGENRSVRLPKGCRKDEFTADEIAKLFAIPFEIGKDENDNPLTMNSGRFGYYVSCNRKNASVKDVHKALSLTADEALQLINKTKQ